MPEAQPAEARRRRWPRPHPVLAGVLGVLMLLLICWPFVETPPPTMRAAFLHVFASWAATIALLLWIARGSGRGADAQGGERDG